MYLSIRFVITFDFSADTEIKIWNSKNGKTKLWLARFRTYHKGFRNLLKFTQLLVPRFETHSRVVNPVTPTHIIWSRFEVLHGTASIASWRHVGMFTPEEPRGAAGGLCDVMCWYIGKRINFWRRQVQERRGKSSEGKQEAGQGVRLRTWEEVRGRSIVHNPHGDCWRCHGGTDKLWIKN